jgi:hypothetical protein
MWNRAKFKTRATEKSGNFKLTHYPQFPRPFHHICGSEVYVVAERLTGDDGTTFVLNAATISAPRPTARAESYGLISWN